MFRRGGEGRGRKAADGRTCHPSTAITFVHGGDRVWLRRCRSERHAPCSIRGRWYGRNHGSRCTGFRLDQPRRCEQPGRRPRPRPMERCGAPVVAARTFRRNGDRSRTCSGELTMSRRSSLAGPLALAFARTRIFVSRTILMYGCAAQCGGLHRSPHRSPLPERR